MLLIGVPAVIVVIYMSIVIGSYKKLNNNGIYLKGKAKAFFPFVPSIIFVIHIAWSIKSITKNPRFSWHIIKLILFKYPLVLGLMIELMLESIAFDLSEQDNIIRLKKRKSLKDAVRKSSNYNLSDIPRKQTKTLLNDYKDTISAATLVS